MVLSTRKTQPRATDSVQMVLWTTKMTNELCYTYLLLIKVGPK